MMRKWEDIIKDKMEEAGGDLPESVFAEFRALREGAVSSHAPKRRPLVWAIAPAAAAGLAAVLFLHRQAAPEDSIQLVKDPVPPVAAVTDSTEVTEPLTSVPLIAQEVKPKTLKSKVIKPEEINLEEIKPEEIKPEEVKPEETKPEEATLESVQRPAEQEEVVKIEDVATDDRAIGIKGIKKERRKTTVGSVTGIITGGGLVTLALASIGGYPLMPMGARTVDSEVLDHLASSSDIGLDPPSDTPKDVLIGSPAHSFPLKFGLSTRIPVSDRFGVTTGLDYSLYNSTFKYSLSGEKRQQAHYLGVPLRMDWLFASGRLIDAYIGGGLEGDICVAASLAGNSIPKDGLSLSLLGAGGLQMNFTKRIGLYVEPELSLRFLKSDTVLETYRSAHPLMFSVATGLRINLDNKVK